MMLYRYIKLLKFQLFPSAAWSYLGHGIISAKHEYGVGKKLIDWDAANYWNYQRKYNLIST